MNSKLLWAFARGSVEGWEATCPDLDISVQGRTFDEVRRLLEEAVGTYIEDACREEPATARRLLNRRAPWWVRLGFVIGFLSHISRRTQRELQAGFDIACPA